MSFCTRLSGQPLRGHLKVYSVVPSSPPISNSLQHFRCLAGHRSVYLVPDTGLARRHDNALGRKPRLSDLCRAVSAKQPGAGTTDRLERGDQVERRRIAHRGLATAADPVYPISPNLQIFPNQRPAYHLATSAFCRGLSQSGRDLPSRRSREDAERVERRARRTHRKALVLPVAVHVPQTVSCSTGTQLLLPGRALWMRHIPR